MPRIGHSPLWNLKGASTAVRLLCWPLLLYEKAFYSRPDVTSKKTRPPEWAALKSEWRFVQAFFCFLGPPSHLLWNIKWPLLVIMAVATFMAVYEEMRACCHPSWVEIDPGNITIQGFRMISFAMSLLLSFRVGRGYDRWQLARNSFAGVGSTAVNLLQQAILLVDDPRLQGEFKRWGLLWHYAVLQVVRQQKEPPPAAAALLSPEELELWRGSAKPRQLAAFRVKMLIAESGASGSELLVMNTAWSKGWEATGSCARIRFQCMPHGLSLVCTGFVQIWLLLLPFGLWTQNNWEALVLMFVIAVLLLGTDEMASQLEDPFPLLPLEDILASTARDLDRSFKEAAALRAISCKKPDAPPQQNGDVKLSCE